MKANGDLEAFVVLASILLGWGRRISYSPSHARLISMRRTGNSMFDLKRKLLVLVIGCLLPVGVYAQRQGDKRPPKDDNKVVVQPKGDKPPQNNNNQRDKPKDDKRGRP